MLAAMHMTVLGSSGTYPVAGRPASGYLVEWGGSTVWMDAGPGTFDALCARADPGELDAVIISHRHPDHCSDLFALFHYLAYGPGGRAPVTVFVPDGAAEHLTGFVGSEAGDGAFERLFDFRTVGDGDGAALGELTLGFASTVHSVPTIGVRLEGGGRALAYSADTGLGGGVLGLAAGADVFLCEATYQEPRSQYAYPFHLTAAEAGTTARDAGAARLILTHIPPALDAAESADEAAATYAGPVEVAGPGMEVEV